MTVVVVATRQREKKKKRNDTREPKVRNNSARRHHHHHHHLGDALHSFPSKRRNERRRWPLVCVFCGPEWKLETRVLAAALLLAAVCAIRSIKQHPKMIHSCTPVHIYTLKCYFLKGKKKRETRAFIVECLVRSKHHTEAIVYTRGE